MNELTEMFFLKYAFPAARFCGVNKDKIIELETRLITDEAPSRQELEELFPVAISRIKKMKHNKDYWNIKSLKDYWLREHNKIVNIPACSVYLAEVIKAYPSRNGIQQARIKIGKKEFNSKSYELVSQGDSVSCHFNQIVERLSSKEIREYFRYQRR